MAKVRTKKRTKKAVNAIEMVLWDVLISYPQLPAKEKNDQGKDVYSVDILVKKDHPDLAIYRKNLNRICIKQFGDDKEEWPEKIAYVKNGNDREDQANYKGRFVIKASSNFPIGVIDENESRVDPKTLRAGMYANVDVKIAVWENAKFGEGVSCYLQNIQVLDKEPLAGFGGARPAKAAFAKGRDEDQDEDEGYDDDDDLDEDQDEEETPRRKSKTKKRPARDEEEDENLDDEDDSDSDDEDDEDDETPRRKVKRKKSRDTDDEDEE